MFVDEAPRRLALDFSVPEACQTDSLRLGRALITELTSLLPGTELAVLVDSPSPRLWSWIPPHVRVAEMRKTSSGLPWLWSADAVFQIAAPSSTWFRPTLTLLGAEAEQLVGGFFSDLERRELSRRLQMFRHSDTLLVTREALRQPVASAVDLPLTRVRAVRLDMSLPAPSVGGHEVPNRGALFRPFLLLPGGARTWHNCLMFLAGYRLLLDRRPDVREDVVVAEPSISGSHRDIAEGSQTAAKSKMASLVERFGLGNRVHLLGTVADDELAALYATSEAIALPWLYQDLGGTMAMLEALRFGRPLLTSNALALPEDARGAALCFDPRRPDSVADAISSLVFDPERRKALAAAAEEGWRLENPKEGLAATCLARIDERRAALHFASTRAKASLPMLSVVTPSLDQGTFIERTLRSVLSQGLPGLEYVVVDGGSCDSTVDLLRRYDRELRWTSAPDRGQADAINKGLRETAGEIVGWLNSDDIYYAGALDEVVHFFAAHHDIDLVYGDADHIDEHDQVIERYPTEDWVYERLKETCYLCQPSVFLRRRVLERFGYLDTRLRYCMDYEYWLRVGPYVRSAHLPVRLAGARLHRAAKTIKARVAVHAEINSMLRRRLGHVPDRWLHNYGWAAVDAAGHDRARLDDYAWRLTTATLWAFLRWRGRIPISILRTAVGWLRAARAQRTLPPRIR